MFKNYRFIKSKTYPPVLIIYFPVGFIYENKKNCGISHLIEHLIMKNMIKNPIAKDLDLNQIFVEGHTNIYYTEFCFATLYRNKNFNKVIEKIWDSIFNLNFNENELNFEKEIIRDEYYLNSNKILKLASCKLYSLIFPKNNILNHTEILYKNYDKLLENINKEEVIRWYKKFFSKFFIIHRASEKLKIIEEKEIKINPPVIKGIKKPTKKKFKSPLNLNGRKVLARAYYLKPNYNFRERFMLSLIIRMLEGFKNSIFNKELFYKGLVYPSACTVFLEDLNGLSLLVMVILSKNINAVRSVLDNLHNFLQNENLFSLAFDNFIFNFVNSAEAGRVYEGFLKNLCIFSKDYIDELEDIIKNKISFKEFAEFLNKMFKKGFYEVEMR